jgi:N6-adenosine-specific RNA methylase IME4
VALSPAPGPDLADAAEPVVPEGQFATIVADPPWRYGNTSTRGAAEDHYPTMSIDELCDLDIARERAADRAHLYLWTTAGHLPEAFRVMEAWDFTYKTYLVWVKPQMGMGNYFRVSTELVLFGVKGAMRTRDMATMNYFEARRGKHSAKPQEFYDLAEKCSPGPYLELFARCWKDRQLVCSCSRCRRGWEVWGNQA